VTLDERADWLIGLYPNPAVRHHMAHVVADLTTLAIMARPISEAYVWAGIGDALRLSLDPDQK
jgi:hypothetical protein